MSRPSAPLSPVLGLDPTRQDSYRRATASIAGQFRVSALRLCPVCRTRRSVRQFVAGSDLCEACRRPRGKR